MHLAYAIDDLGSGGAQRQVVELSTRIATMDGVRVSLLTYRERNFYAERLRDARVPVVNIRKLGKLDPLYPLRLARWLGGNAVDVVHAFLPIPAFWTCLALRLLPRGRRPALVSGERNMLQGSGAYFMGLRHLAYPRSVRVTANAKAVAAEIVEKLGVPGERVVYIPNGIDTRFWAGAASGEPPREVEPGLFHLALVARFAPQKNHRLVLEALSTLPRAEIASWRVWFVGDEEYPGQSASLRREIEARDLGGIVRIRPPIPAIAPFLARMDGLILPSRREGFPNVVLEAMTLGLPVIASSAGDLPEMIDPDRTGILLDPCDAGSLARALAALHRMSAGERRAMGARARARVEERFTIAAVAARHVDLYRSILEGKGESGRPTQSGA